MINVTIILDAQMVSSKMCPNLTKKIKFAQNFEAHISEFGSPNQNSHSAKYLSYVIVY